MSAIHCQITEKRLGVLAAEHREAATALCRAVKDEYPLGSIVEATIHRCRIRGVVEEHSENWWHEPGTFFIRNVLSGKVRTVNPLAKSQDVRLVSLPENHLQPI